METACDGNESLKRIKRMRKVEGKAPESSERPDSRTLGNPQYVSEDYVNEFKDEVKGSGRKPRKAPAKGKGKEKVRLMVPVY